MSKRCNGEGSIRTVSYTHLVARLDIDGQSGTLAKGPDGSVFAKNQWVEIRNNTYPSSEGINGQISADGLWKFTDRYHEWSWMGPKL